MSTIATNKEANFMLAVIQNNKGNLTVDWVGVATAMGLKNGSTASVRFGQIKKKLGLTGNTATGGTTGGGRVSKPRTPTKPRGTTACKPTPTKDGTPTKARAAKAKVASSKLSPIAEEDSDAESEYKGKTKRRDTLEASSDDEAAYEGKDKGRDLMFPSDDEEYFEDEQETFEARVSRGDFDEDEELSESAVAQINKEYAPKVVSQPVTEEYDAYDPDAIFEDELAASDRQLYVPTHN